MVRRLVTAVTASCCFMMLLVLATYAQDKTSKPTNRARPPKFDNSITSQFFFDDVFTKLDGERPSTLSAIVVAPTPVGNSNTAANSAGSGAGWSKVISATTLEDEIKAIRLEVDKTITTPSDFAGRGHKVVRRDFTLLSMLFAIISEYDGNVRWKSSGAAARDVFGRTASNAKAGGNSNVYKEVKLRQAELQDLVGGSPMQAQAEPETSWDKVADRSPLMQRLESSYQERLNSWTSSEDQFKQNVDTVMHEAEILAAIAEVLTKEGMEDGDDEDYAGYARRMGSAALNIVSAVKLNSYDQARKSVGEIGKACSECHELYR